MPHKDPEALRAYSRRRYLENREAILARVKAWSEANPGRAAARCKAWRQRNLDRARALEREWYLANRERLLERTRENAAERFRRDPEAFRAQGRERSARRRARVLGVTVEKVDPQFVWERDEGICGICGEGADRLDWHLDHIIAVSNGGSHSYANVQVSHPLCNRRKAAS